jgi:rubrerythrin
METLSIGGNMSINVYYVCNVCNFLSDKANKFCSVCNNSDWLKQDVVKERKEKRRDIVLEK